MKTKKSSIERIVIGKANQKLVNFAKEVGIDIDGFEHEISEDFKRHVLKQHGDERKESLHGQTAIKPEDFEKIPKIINSPDITLIGAHDGKHDLIAYTKKMDDGTTFYIEEILDSNRNKSLRSKTMHKHKVDIDKDKFYNIMHNNNITEYDMSRAKIFGL